MAKALSTLPVGALVKDTGTLYNGKPIIWKIADKGHVGYPSGSVTLITERIISLKCFDAKEPSNSNSNRKSYGNNRWIYSNIRQWLNSQAGAGAWYSAQHSADAPPNNANVWSNYNEYEQEAGFLAGFSANFLAALLSTTHTVGIASSVSSSSTESCVDKIFLATGEEVGLSGGVTAGSKLALFSRDNNSRLAYPTAEAVSKSEYTSSSLSASEPWWWWLADAIDYGPFARIITSSGALTSTHAYYCYHGVRPLCNIKSEILVSDSPDSDGAYTIIWNRAPSMPSSITVPSSVRGGKNLTVSWPASSDPDGNLDGYIVERSYNGGSSWSQIYQGRTTGTTTTIPFGTETVMFRVCAYDTYGEKSGWRTSENRTVVNNRAPAAPPSISVPLSPAGGDKLTITWTASTDADGNLEGYELERQWDGSGAFTQIYKGAALSYQDSIPKGTHSSVIYRVRAYDSFTSYSSYTTSPSRTIDNNTAPVIACDLSGDLGEKSEGFTIPYTVSDAERQEVTVTEKVGNLVKRTYKPTLGRQNTFEVTGEYLQKILNGAQTVQIVATDSAGKSSTLSLAFTKAVHRAVITLSEPLAVEKQITVAVLAITGKIPVDAECTVELTNNGSDPEPVWEDATADVKAGRNHPFQNKTQTNGWAFNFRVTVERGESGEDGNIVSIQGGFQ